MLPDDPVIYQIYPRSFRDTTGSGEGDLQGILDRLEYVASLGVDGIWLSPFYCTDFDDGGYDVCDHRAVDPRFGTIEDFDAIVAKAHELGLGVMIDQVLNHVSHKHVNFEAALEGNEKMAQWFVFRDPNPDGTAPNNWLSQFGPPAWTWSHERRQYYLHQFLDCQPNLDMRHPDVQDDHRKTLRFWLDRGVDAFRLDAVTSYLHDENLRDNPPASFEVHDKVSGPNHNPYTYQDHRHDMIPGDGAAYMEKIKQWGGEACFLLGESTSGNKSVQLALDFTEPGRLDSVYTTDLPEAATDPGKIADALMAAQGRWGRLTWWLSSHDQPRSNSAHGDGSWASARFYQLLLSLLPGPLLIYQGQELGLPQPELRQEEVTDPFDLLYWPEGPGREGARVPIPWTSQGPGWGFTSGTPWLPMRWAEHDSVEHQEAAAESPLQFTRRSIAFRRKERLSRPDTFAALSENDVLRLDILLDGRGWRALFNFSDTVPVDGDYGEPALSSGPLENGKLPPQTAAVWGYERKP
ncbi:alpha-amylase family glycosyl hydrolase [Histidinibacterium aquaticum]|uniref:alpha-amylase family glycosyl hydrolase n=1 Tax=Histidinibacterium aquaticum TaxID=2613962 RepID=UPI00168C037C|nr:alpha-amylase family glycosyl hydrolase [Histidinibacterium aquaticum]